MKPREKNGVVDPSLNVYGVRNLKVVDLSICPVSRRESISTLYLSSYQDNLGTNTYSSALLVGEKGADLVAEDLGMYPRRTRAISIALT